MIGVEFIVYPVGQKLLRNGNIRKRGIPQHGIDVFDAFYPFAELFDILVAHVLHDDKRKSALAEILCELCLADRRVEIIRQIIQHIVVDSCSRHAEHRRYHKQQRDNEYRHAELYNSL